MGGKSQKSTTTQTNDPWAPAQGNLKDILGNAQNLYNRGSQYYNFSTVTPFSGQTENALTGIENAANGSFAPGFSTQGKNALSGLLGASQPTLEATARGDYLNNNPYLGQMFNAMSGNVEDAVNSQFSAAGRTGSPAHVGEMTRQLGNLGAQIYGQNYATERQNQLSAANQGYNNMGMAGALNDLGYDPYQRLAQVGASREGLAQNQLKDLMARWDFGQNQPWTDLARYQSIVDPIASAGGTQTAVSKQPVNVLGNLLGGVFGGVGALSSMGAFGAPAAGSKGWLF